MPRFLSNLGIAPQRRFIRLENLTDIENAIYTNQKVVDLTPDGHPHRPDYFSNLGNALSARLERLQNLEELDGVLQACSQVAKSPIGSPINRFRAARAWARHSEKYSRSPLPAYNCAIGLLPRVAWLGLEVSDQHELLVDIGGIVRDAVSAAIQLGKLEVAVEWAEQGRSIVWQNLLGLRTPIDDLRATHPQLADKIRDIARQMEASTSQTVSNADIRSAQLVIAWENAVEEVRKLPGFEGFLRAKTFSQLSHVAHEGPVVILNVSDSRSDALVLAEDESEDKHVSVVSIPLTRFSYETGRKLREKLTELLTLAGFRDRGETRKTGRVFSGGGNIKAAFQKILRILWLDVVQPVIDTLKYQVRHLDDG